MRAVRPAEFFSTSRLVIVAGKGGVGKTAVSATLARAAALTGLSTLVVQVDSASGLAAMFGHGPLGFDEVLLSPGGGPDGAADVRARAVTADGALLEYLRDHGMSRVSRRLVASGALDVVAAAVPGIKDILLLGKVKQLERSGAVDLVVLDAPAAGHAITFLQSARALLDAVKVGPIQTQARDVSELLEDHDRCQVVLVTLPEETPVNEAVETAYLLEDRVGVGLGPVVLNGLYPDLGPLDVDPAVGASAAGVELSDEERRHLTAAAAFRRERATVQRRQVTRLEEELPLPQLRLPFLFTAALGPPEIDRLADALLDEIARLPLPEPGPR